MQNNPVLAYLSGAIALAASYFVYYELRFMGFPDGFLSELDRARQVLFRIFIGVSIPAGLWFFALGWLASRQRIRKQLAASLIGYLAFIALLFITDLYLGQNLTGSGGG